MYNLPEQKGRSLLQVALDVHMYTTGASERPYQEQQDDIKLLQKKIIEWEPSVLLENKAFDDLVRLLCIQSLVEALKVFDELLKM